MNPTEPKSFSVLGLRYVLKSIFNLDLEHHINSMQCKEII